MDGSELIVENPSVSEAPPNATESAPTAKKKFVTPEVSVPVDVLEATTYFQVATSGATT